MKKNETKDQLFESFRNFQIARHSLNTTIGGATNHTYADSDGCTGGVVDLPGGGISTWEDYISEG